MYHQGIQGLPYYLGIRSLAEVATAEDRVVLVHVERHTTAWAHRGSQND